METNKSAIGVFDSGVGGLTVLKRLKEAMPDEDYIYFGDTARVPYGNKTKEQLLDFGRNILDFFKEKRVKAVVIACNTSSAVTYETLKNEYDFELFSLILPTAKVVADGQYSKIGVMATLATINSHAYKNEIGKITNKTEVLEVACPKLVEIVEKGQIESSETIVTLKEYLTPLMMANVEKIILGCTHYPFLKDKINTITQRKIGLIDPAEALTIYVKEFLSQKFLLNSNNNGKIKYYVSSNPEQFQKNGSLFLENCDLPEIIEFKEKSKL